MTIRVFVFFLVGSLAWGVVPTEARAQGSAVDFPHGPLPEGLGCADCHSTRGWSPLDPDRSFDHGAVTGFRLVGNHAQAPCASCHRELRFSAMEVAPDACGSCHLDVHQGTLSADCTRCHTPEGFSEVSGIRIHQTTDFLLEGAHLQLSCESCHATDRGGAYSPIPSSCMACHREEFEAPKTVDHVTLGFPENCLACHSPNSWSSVGAFNHVSYSGGFDLQGAHAELTCGRCHIPGGGLRFPTPSSPEDCISCHQADYQGEHGGSGYPTTCLTCHNLWSWEGADDDHAQLSGGFVLDGAHDGMACTNCHTPDGHGTLFSPAGSQDCMACHQADYQREHVGSGYPADCATCHTTSGWDGARADHATLSGGYLLEGAHETMVCTNCHTPDGHGHLLSPAGPQDCVACHQADYQREHSGSGYPSTCATCHTTVSWPGVQVDHAALSNGYVLEGAHGVLACASCHTADGSGTLFNPTGPDDCVACHQADYQREHTGSGYPSSCLTCHTATRWDEVSADHAAISNGFVLVGNHDRLACASCHIVPGMQSLFSPSDAEDCLACHMADFQREHSGSGYPGTCLTCHVVTTWAGAQFNHDAAFFPINSGKHLGQWSTCSTCHPSPTDLSVFTCLNCHEHERAQTDADHSQVQGYVYESGQCLSCHPTGN